MQNQSVKERLDAIRQEIDNVDQELLAILNRRAVLSVAVGNIKAEDTSPIFKPQREMEVLANLEQSNKGPLLPEHLRTIWREIFSSSRALQRSQYVAYLGPEGTFSYFAAMEYLGKSATFQPCNNFEDVFRAVNDGHCQLGVIPLENSLQGTVGACFDLFYRFDLGIQAELLLRISHGLLSTSANLQNIKRVYSHPQAIAQCDSWLRANLPHAELVPTESTAAAARRAAEDSTSAAIGHMALAGMFSLNVLSASIESSNDNWTRFVIIAKAAAKPIVVADMPSSGMIKSSVLFTLHDEPGSLSHVLQELAKYGVNLRKLESRPLKLSGGQCWRYVFFADLETDIYQKDYAALVEKLHSICSSFRVLGVYPIMQALDSSEHNTMQTSVNQEGNFAC